MEYLLHPQNLRILQSFCIVKTLFAFDYDGTLAPITEDPANAHMKKEVSDLLRELNQHSPVAIITGRKSDDVRRFLPIDPMIIIGNHGSEGTQSETELQTMKALCQTWVQSLNILMPLLNGLGVTIEDKIYSLSFHFRNSHNPEVAEQTLLQVLGRLPVSRVVMGKFVINVVPEFSSHKGMALDLLMKQRDFPFGVFFGDDNTDEDVFRFSNPRLLTVKVGLEKTSAKFHLKNQSEIEIVLKHLNNFMYLEAQH